MWIVFNHEDSWEQGYSVSSESEARKICEDDMEMTYCYVGMATIAYCM